MALCQTIGKFYRCLSLTLAPSRSYRDDTMRSGPEQLKDWMHRRRFLQRETAEYLGWDETYVSQLLNARRSPGLDNAVHMERLTGIPVEAWASDELDKLAAATATSSGKLRHGKA